MDKLYINAQQLLEDSYRLAWQVYQSGYRPNYIVGVWRGGAPVGIAVQELLDVVGVDSDHIAIRTSYQGQPSYSKMVDKADSIRAHGLRYLHERVCEHHSMLNL